MIVAFSILLPVFGVVWWVFFRFMPKSADRKALARFNLLSIGVAFLLAVTWSVRTHLVMSSTVDSAWWPVISLLGSLFIASLVIGLAAILRNFVLFRRGTEDSR